MTMRTAIKHRGLGEDGLPPKLVLTFLVMSEILSRLAPNSFLESHFAGLLGRRSCGTINSI